MPEKRRVILNNEALSDLEGIAQYIRQDSPQNAAVVAEAILDAIDSLASMSERFKRVGKSRKRRSPVHALVVHPFIVYYRIDAEIEAVHILKIVHGARRQPRRFK